MPGALLANQPQLIVPNDLLRYGASSDFLAQFQPRPLNVQIVQGGPLGTMTWIWQQQGDAALSAAISSEAAPYIYGLPDPAFCVITFAAGTYNANDLYTVSSSGSVSGPSSLLSATRFDVRNDACLEVVSQAITWMTPRVVPPVTSVGPQIFGWMADLVIYRLRSRQGMTPPGAGPGDDNIRARAATAEKNLREIGINEDRPPDIVDSSPGNAGAGFPAMPVSDSLRGW